MREQYLGAVMFACWTLFGDSEFPLLCLADKVNTVVFCLIKCVKFLPRDRRRRARGTVLRCVTMTEGFVKIFILNQQKRGRIKIEAYYRTALPWRRERDQDPDQGCHVERGTKAHLYVQHIPPNYSPLGQSFDKSNNANRLYIVYCGGTTANFVQFTY